jgi:adenylate cyclase
MLQYMNSPALSREELAHLREVSQLVDDLLEQSLKSRENLSQTFARAFPQIIQAAGAIGIVLSTHDEELEFTTFHHGEFFGKFPGHLFENQNWGVHQIAGNTFVSQKLDLSGHPVGSIGFLFAGDRSKEAAVLARLVDTVAEELDTVLASIHTAAEKHQLLMLINQALSNRVFEIGMDAAVRVLCDKIRIPGFLLVYRDAVVSSAVHYRSYKNGQLEYASNGRPSDAIDEAIQVHGPALVNPLDTHLRAIMRDKKSVETVLISGVVDAHALGKIMVWSEGDGFSSFTLDLLKLLGSTLSQRLIDYNRERIHLSQFFAPAAIDELLKDPNYEQRNLSAREEDIGIVFCDINGFTRICEQVLQKPERIGRFVDSWSEEAVRILHNHGGVFDKMVGDCVIGLWGPPFFKSTKQERAEQALLASIELQRFTRETMNAHPEMAKISEGTGMPGLGVAIGVNLAPSFVGLFGPNRNYTAFSTGMNQTARLQSLGTFRETLVMQVVKDAAQKSTNAQVRNIKFGPMRETHVKNVAHPLKYFQLLD